MSTDIRMNTILNCLQLAFNGQIGVIVKRNDTMKYMTEIYPYKGGMYILYTIHDSRALIFEDRKLLVFVDERANIEILGECDIRNSQSIDTCITEEFLDARYTYDVLYEKSKSFLFRKKHNANLQEKVDYCKEIAKNAIQVIKLREHNDMM